MPTDHRGPPTSAPARGSDVELAAGPARRWGFRRMSERDNIGGLEFSPGRGEWIEFGALR